MEATPELKSMADRMSGAVRDYIARALAPISTRLAAVEVRTGALSMIAARGTGEAPLAHAEDLVHRIAALESRLNELALGDVAPVYPETPGLFDDPKDLEPR